MKGHGCPQIPSLMRPTSYISLTKEEVAYENLVQFIDVILS